MELGLLLVGIKGSILFGRVNKLLPAVVMNSCKNMLQCFLFVINS